VHYTWKVAEKRFKIAFMMNKHAMIISFEIIFEKQKYFFFAKNHHEIQVYTLYSIKYSTLEKIGAHRSGIKSLVLSLSTGLALNQKSKRYKKSGFT
jgi:hypothetical protein